MFDSYGGPEKSKWVKLDQRKARSSEGKLVALCYKAVKELPLLRVDMRPSA